MNRLSLLHQAGVIRSYFPGTDITRKGETELTWVGWLQPTHFSPKYKVKLHFHRKTGVYVYVLKPKLEIAKGCVCLPHIYNENEQKLCLFYPKDREWNAGMWFAKTIIPWASEWLYFYELWLATDGEWLGGGMPHVQAPVEFEENKKEQ